MQAPVQVSFHGLPVDDAIERMCLDEAEKLERYYDRITSCRVVVTRPQKRHRQGDLYEIRIDVKAPGSEIAITRTPPAHKPDEQLALAVREAFDTARRRLEDHVRHKRGMVKQHEAVEASGRVTRLEADHGFITAEDGHEVYFHRNSLQGELFDRLSIGADVRFREELGKKGPQAIVVHHRRERRDVIP